MTPSGKSSVAALAGLWQSGAFAAALEAAWSLGGGVRGYTLESIAQLALPELLIQGCQAAIEARDSALFERLLAAEPATALLVYDSADEADLLRHPGVVEQRRGILRALIGGARILALHDSQTAVIPLTERLAALPRPGDWGYGFLRCLLEPLWPEALRTGQAAQVEAVSVLRVLLVQQRPAAASETEMETRGRVALLRCERLAGGRGDLFPAADMALRFRDWEFQQAERTVATVLADMGVLTASRNARVTCDIRYSLQPLERETIPTRLAGGSLGAGLALSGARLLAHRRPWNALNFGGIAVSAALKSRAQLEPIGGVSRKLMAAAHDGVVTRVCLSAADFQHLRRQYPQQEEANTILDEELGLEILGGESLDELAGRLISGRWVAVWIWAACLVTVTALVSLWIWFATITSRTPSEQVTFDYAEQFYPGDVDLTALRNRLADPADHFSNFLRDRLDSVTRKILDTQGSSPPEWKTAQIRVTQTLNQIIEGYSMYNPGRFDKVSLRAATSRLLKQKGHTVAEMSRLNRMLLEDALTPMVLHGPEGHSLICDRIFAWDRDLPGSFGNRKLHWFDINWNEGHGWLFGGFDEQNGTGQFLGHGVLLHTFDQGKTWAEIALTNSDSGQGTVSQFLERRWDGIGPVHSVYAQTTSESDGSHCANVWIASLSGIFFSTNSLTEHPHWHRITPTPANPEGYSYFSGMLVNDNAREIYSYGWQGIAHLERGRPWDLQMPTYHYCINGMAVLDKWRNDVWAVGGGGASLALAGTGEDHDVVYHFNNATGKWEHDSLGGCKLTVQQSLFGICEFQHANRGLVVVGGGGLILRSWLEAKQRIWKAQKATKHDLVFVISHQESDLWVVGHAGTVLHSRNNGESWELCRCYDQIGQPLRGEFDKIRIVGESAWLIGTDGVFNFTLPQ